MSQQEHLTTKSPDEVIRCIVIGLLLASAVALGFPSDVITSTLSDLVGIGPVRSVRFLSRLWLLSAPVGALVGITFASLVLRSSRLAIDTINLLRIAQWAPFLITWTLAFAVTAEWKEGLSRLWLSCYCATAVGLRIAYEYLLVRGFDDLGWKAAIKQVLRPAIVQGLFIALLLDIFVLAELWNPWLGRGVGYAVFILVGTVMLLTNWLTGESFQSAALNHGRSLVKAFETENYDSLIGPSLIVLLCFFLWVITAPFLFTISPASIFASLATLLKENEFYRDLWASFGELGLGMVISGSLAATLTFLRQQSAIATRISDPLLQVCQLAPIAMLPNLQTFFGLMLSRWSVLCVVIFTFHPFLSALTGLAGLRIVPRVVLAISETLPYGCAAFVFGEMWNATAGIGFMMTVAAATQDVNKGMAGFFVLMVLFALTSIALHCIAKKAASTSDLAIKP
jgi:ABC-type nitrate/sulfonate/bicarbonate transport system permease component